MKITFLAHSGFFIELEHVCLLFDWWKGALPPLPEDKPLVVMASHHHTDHFQPAIFSLAQPGREIRFLLGKDIRLSPGHRPQWGVTDEIYPLCQTLGGLRREEPFPGVVVETLPSTDKGVAFIVTTEGRTIYHAGDLHWWCCKGESDAWFADMVCRYKEYTAPLQNRHIDLAMVPLDSRLEESEQLGLAHLMKIAQIEKVLPMHQWEDFSATDRFMADYPQWANHLLPIQQEGEVFFLP